MSWNGSGNISSARTPTAPQKKGGGISPAVVKGVFGGLAVVVVILAAFFIFDRARTPAAPQDDKKMERTVPKMPKKRTAQEKAREIVEAGIDQSIKTNAVQSVAGDFPYTDGRKVISSKTNSWDQVIDICIMPNGKRRKVIRNLRKPLFSNMTDSIIARALATGNEEAGPPLPIDENMEEAFIESLKTPIEFNANDSDEIKERKMMVKEAREQILSGIANGGTFFGILSEHVSQQKHNAELKEVVMDTVTELRESGDAETLNQYLEEANKLLGENGVSPVDANAGEEDSENEESKE